MAKKEDPSKPKLRYPLVNSGKRQAPPPPHFDDKKMMLDYANWPCWPTLPIKRKNHSIADKNLGILVATQEYVDALKGKSKIVVYHVYMYGLPKTKEEWAAAPKTEYDTIDALLADGWIVD